MSCPTTRKFLTLGIVKARGQGMQLSTAPAQHEHLTRVLRRLVELYEEAHGGDFHEDTELTKQNASACSLVSLLPDHEDRTPLMLS